MPGQMAFHSLKNEMKKGFEKKTKKCKSDARNRVSCATSSKDFKSAGYYSVVANVLTPKSNVYFLLFKFQPQNFGTLAEFHV